MWISYRQWSGSVVGRRIRVPTRSLHVGVFGPSLVTHDLRAGAIGHIKDILRENVPFPRYVNFAGLKPDLSFAAEVRIERRENPEIVWKDLKPLTDQDSALFVVTRPILDGMEIEHSEQP
jgi:hypothetical protein